MVHLGTISLTPREVALLLHSQRAMERSVMLPKVGCGWMRGWGGGGGGFGAPLPSIHTSSLHRAPSLSPFQTVKQARADGEGATALDGTDAAVASCPASAAATAATGAALATAAADSDAAARTEEEETAAAVAAAAAALEVKPPVPFSLAAVSCFTTTNVLQAALGAAPVWAPPPRAAVEAAEAAALAAALDGRDPLAAASMQLPAVGEPGFVTGSWPVGSVSFLMLPLRPRDGADEAAAAAAERAEIAGDAVLGPVLLGDGHAEAEAAAGGSGGDGLTEVEATDEEEEGAAPYSVDWLFFRELAVGPIPALQFIEAAAAADDASSTAAGASAAPLSQDQRERARRRALVDRLWPLARRLAERPQPLVSPEECLAAVMEGAGGFDAALLRRVAVFEELRARAVVTQHRGQVRAGCWAVGGLQRVSQRRHHPNRRSHQPTDPTPTNQSAKTQAWHILGISPTLTPSTPAALRGATHAAYYSSHYGLPPLRPDLSVFEVRSGRGVGDGRSCLGSSPAARWHQQAAHSRAQAASKAALVAAQRARRAERAARAGAAAAEGEEGRSAAVAMGRPPASAAMGGKRAAGAGSGRAPAVAPAVAAAAAATSLPAEAIAAERAALRRARRLACGPSVWREDATAVVDFAVPVELCWVLPLRRAAWGEMNALPPMIYRTMSIMKLLDAEKHLERLQDGWRPAAAAGRAAAAGPSALVVGEEEVAGEAAAAAAVVKKAPEEQGEAAVAPQLPLAPPPAPRVELPRPLLMCALTTVHAGEGFDQELMEVGFVVSVF